MVTGKELARGGEWFQRLKNLIRERNFIIHSKSSEGPYSIEDLHRYAEKDREDRTNLFKKVKGAIDLLDVLPAEIGKIDSEELHWASIYLSKPSTTLEEK